MSIRDISPLSTRHADHLAKKPVTETQTGSSADARTKGPSVQSPEAARDRVEISEAGRKAQAGSVHSAAELDFAKKALAEAQPLSEERAAQIKARLQEGYYLTREAADVVAAGLAATLKGSEA